MSKDKTKSRCLHKSDAKARLWRQKGSADYPGHTSSSEKHVGGSIMTWDCMAATGRASLIFNGDRTYRFRSLHSF